MVERRGLGRLNRTGSTVGTLSADDWRAWRELRLQALEEAPYAFGTTLSEWQGEGDTELRWRDRLNSVPFNAIARIDGTPAGIVSATAPDAGGTSEMISMWVAPFARGRGIGDALVHAVLLWCTEHGARRITLDVVESNEHAIVLYRRHGFAFAGDFLANAPGERSMVRCVRFD